MFAASKTDGVVAGGPPPSGDPYWSNVSLLTNFENNLSFQDGSTNNFAITRNGVVNPSLNTPFSGGVGGSEYFNGSSYLGGAANAAYAFGTGDFTVEAWVYITANSAVDSGGGRTAVIFRNAVTGTVGFQFMLGGDATTTGVSLSAYTSSGMNVAYTYAFAKNTWYHVAASRSSGTVKLFVNGVQGASVAAAQSAGNSGSKVEVGGSAYSGYPNYLIGNISNARVVKGTAVYTTAFTPPTAPLTAITNTSLLITGTGQGMFNNSTFVDQGPNALTMTATGAPVYSGRSPFGNTYAGSVLYSGTSQYLTSGSSSGFAVGTGDFTVDFWVYFTGSTDFNAILDTRSTGASAGFWISNNTQASKGFRFGTSGAVVLSVGGQVNNTWQHVAAVRQSGTLIIYVGGVSQGSTTDTRNYTDTQLKIAAFTDGSTPYQGYISNLRIVKGTAVYTSNFTPPTTPLTAITNTSLLVRGDTGAFYDLSNVGNSESGVGSATVTTQVKKFGNESGSFNGTTSYLTAPDNAAFNMGAADFTLEAWIYLTATPGAFTNNGANVINKDGKAFVSWSQYNLFVNASLKVCASFTSVPNAGAGPTATIVGSTTLSLNTWYYVAVTRSGVNGTVWVNGASNGTTASIPSTLNNGARALYIGHEESQAAYAYFPGYIDDIRITKGVARTITTPTATFPTGP